MQNFDLIKSAPVTVYSGIVMALNLIPCNTSSLMRKWYNGNCSKVITQTQFMSTVFNAQKQA